MSLTSRLRSLCHLAVDPNYRRGRWLALRHPENLFQPYPTTHDDRYPVIFRFVREALGDAPTLRLLSFGCSTGEEPFTLRRYFPTSFIAGIDIDARNIAACERKRQVAGESAMRFTVASSTAGEESASYDAIFCMAVLRHGALADADRSDPLLHFADFERTVADFARCLAPDGLLALRHANFRFADSETSRGFETVLELPSPAKAPLFGRDNRRLAGVTYGEVVFRKR